MSVTIAKSAGFCFGVSRAVELVEKAATEGTRVVTLGPIIHNRHVVKRFEEMVENNKRVAFTDIPDNMRQAVHAMQERSRNVVIKMPKR